MVFALLPTTPLVPRSFLRLGTRQFEYGIMTIFLLHPFARRLACSKLSLIVTNVVIPTKQSVPLALQLIGMMTTPASLNSTYGMPAAHISSRSLNRLAFDPIASRFLMTAPLLPPQIILLILSTFTLDLQVPASNHSMKAAGTRHRLYFLAMVLWPVEPKMVQS